MEVATATSSSSSSSSSMVRPKKHGVFLSFHSSDTRYNFVSHLYEALSQQGIPTFLDSETLERGEKISAILDEIENSKVSVIIFSEKYASSTWCLDELERIMECMKNHGQVVLPVFYHVRPEAVRSQSGSFGAALARHEEIMKDNVAKVKSWRAALTDAANISGWILQNDRPEAAACKEIVEIVLRKLKHECFINDYEDMLQDLVGMHKRIQEVEGLLGIGQEGTRVRVVGLWGLEGIGKTTLAQVLFKKYSLHFEGSCFLQNMREESERLGICQIQEQLLAKLLNGGIVSSVATRRRLRHKKVFIVLDDISNHRQFEVLVGKRDSLGYGSLVLVTSREKQILKNLVDRDCIYEVPALSENEALELFSMFAFKGDMGMMRSSHLELAKEIVNYAQGNPQALKVLGQFLFDKSKSEWESAMLKMWRYPNMDIQSALKLSFDGFEDHKDIRRCCIFL